MHLTPRIHPLRLAQGLVRRLRRFRPYRGTQRADSLAELSWHAPTPLPALQPLPPVPFRVPPYVLTASDRVRQFYDALELRMELRIAECIVQSRYAWNLSHA